MKRSFLIVLCCLMAAFIFVSCEPKTPECKTYTVTWKNEDGAVLKTDTVAEGTTPLYTGEDPRKEATAEFSYTFDGWTPEVVPVAADCEYTAKYTSTKRTYSVVWKLDAETVAKTDILEYGATPSFGETAPSKAATAEFTYTFTGWDKTIASVTGDETYTALFSSTKNKYKVIWVDGNGNNFKVDTLEYGIMPTVPEGLEPAKNSTPETNYTFNGQWLPEIVAVTGDATYIAQFDSAVRTYTITWKNENGTTLKTDALAYGATPEYTGDTPTKDSTATNSFEFSGWSPAIVNVTENATYTAQYNATVRKYTIRWIDSDGNVYATKSLEYGEKVGAYPGETPVKTRTPQYTYTFTGWSDNEFASWSVVADRDITARFSSTVNTYTVIYQREDGTEIARYTEPYGAVPPQPEIPSKASTAQYTYNKSWDKPVVTVAEDVTYKATYAEVLRKYNIRWIGYDNAGNVVDLRVDQVEYGTTPVYGGDTPTRPSDSRYVYTFKGWDREIEAVTGDASYYARFNENDINRYYFNYRDNSPNFPLMGLTEEGKKLTTVTIPSFITHIQDEACKDSTAMTTLTIPASVRFIEKNSFENCTALTTLTIENGTTQINIEAFKNCSSLITLSIPGSVTRIKDWAFNGCASLTSVTLAEGVQQLDYMVFGNCSKLTTINIPSTLTAIGQSCFASCNKLETINFNGTKAQWEAITKGTNWDANTGAYTVHCTDGDIAK